MRFGALTLRKGEIMMNFKYNGKEYQIKTECFEVQVTKVRYRAIAVCDDERVEIPGAVSDTESNAQMLGLLTVAFAGEDKVEI